MYRERFVVKFVTANNCFAQLPNIWLYRLETKENVIEILHNEKIYYLSCIPHMSTSKTLCIGATFARNLNIQEEDEVFVSSVKNVPTLSSIKIVPRTTIDLELLELLKDRVQSNLLNEVRIVAKGQPIVAWISKFSSVTFIVEDLEPKFIYGLLEQFTEVHVLDAIVNSKMENVDVKRDAISNSLTKILSYFTKEKDHRYSRDNAANHALLQSFLKKSLPYIFRVYPLPKFQSIDQLNAHDLIPRCPFHILVPRSCLPKGTQSTNGIMCKIKKVRKNTHRATTTNSLRDESRPNSSLKDNTFVPTSLQELVARIYILEDILEKCSTLDRKYFDLNSIHCGVYVSDSLRVNLELKVGCRVIVEMMEGREQPKPSSIDIFPLNKSITEEFFKNYVKIYSKHEALLLNSYSMISLDGGNQCVIVMSPKDHCNYAMIDEKDLTNLTIHIRSPINMSDRNSEEILKDHIKQSLNLEKISNSYIETILDECKIALDLSLGLQRQMEFLYDRENILICGGMGSGKTIVYKMLIEHYCRAPYFVHTSVINCKSLRGKKVETIQPLIKSAMSECVYYQPSILFLDDLESITNVSLNEESTLEMKNASRITDMLINTVTEYQKSHYISIVATCNGISKIGSKLQPAKGVQFFRTVLELPNLEKVDRIDILRLSLGDKLCVPGDMNWNYYGNKTEGWMPQDLVDLAEKAKFVSWKRHAAEKSKSSIVVTDEDVNAALKNFIPMSLHGAQLYKSGEHSWSDVGGLADTKRSLMEILQWPLKYPEIFKNAPIKLQSGVLLYGMPGTGKTMLAKAIANECGVNLISIKGPELLSKYVGASEESVRNVFERAHRAKPCVLFFDEFDSFASRRGEDNTGVTDRVVNQLLTQLDGIEDREGVAIVAASSRPDLLDPAILRPGRLDKYLHCPLPNETDRKAIFAVSCKSQNIDQSKLDLKELIQLSNGFTGADINAAITLARLSAFEDALAIAADNKIDAANIKVMQTHLVESIKSTKPSLSNAEKLKYNKIYARFSKGENFADDILKNQRVTLA